MRGEGAALDKLQKLVDLIEHVRNRPPMYLGSVDAGLATAWIHGFSACAETLLAGIERNRWFEFRQRAVESRGLTWSARHPADELRERGLAEKEIIDELLLIETAVFKAAQSFLDGRRTTDN